MSQEHPPVKCNSGHRGQIGSKGKQKTENSNKVFGFEVNFNKNWGTALSLLMPVLVVEI